MSPFAMQVAIQSVPQVARIPSSCLPVLRLADLVIYVVDFLSRKVPKWH